MITKDNRDDRRRVEKALETMGFKASKVSQHIYSYLCNLGNSFSVFAIQIYVTKYIMNLKFIVWSLFFYVQRQENCSHRT